MTQAFRYDVATCQQDIHLNWIELLSYLGARYGGDFSRYSSSDMDKLAEQLKNGTSMDELTKDLKYYSYYLEAYNAVLGGMVGYYEIQIPQSEAPAFALSDTQINEGDPGAGGSEGESPDSAGNQAPSVEPLTPAGEQKVWVTKYGLKAFHSMAKNFPYSYYDDFGVSRSYGSVSYTHLDVYKRQPPALIGVSPSLIFTGTWPLIMWEPVVVRPNSSSIMSQYFSCTLNL